MSCPHCDDYHSLRLPEGMTTALHIVTAGQPALQILGIQPELGAVFTMDDGHVPIISASIVDGHVMVTVLCSVTGGADALAEVQRLLDSA